jgi:putative transposase
MSHEQSDISSFAPETDEIEVTRTVRLKLVTSNTKNDVVEQGIKAYQSVLSYMADHMPSYPEYEWTPRHSHMYHHAKRGLPDDDTSYKTTLALQAQQQVAEAFSSWRERGKPGDSPRGEFGDGRYLGLRNDDVEIVNHDHGGYGLKASFISYNPVWFGIDAGEFQREFLDRVTDPDDEARAGSAELHLQEDGELYCHLTVSWPVETYKIGDVSTTVGVDLNDDPLVAVAVVSEGSVEDVEFESGAKFRHHREQLKQKRSEAMEKGDLKAIRDARLNYNRYTDHITNVASRAVVEVAAEYAPCRIQLEELTYYRETAEDPIHDWPFAEIREKIIYKAKEEGLPAVFIDPKGTSITCRKCGERNPAMRDGSDFHCWECGYEVHADVNAAINIAQKSPTT